VLINDSTLFWGGATFTPSLTVPSDKGGKTVNIQSYLQDAFLGAVGKLVEAVGDVESVMGFEVSSLLSFRCINQCADNS
jgi:hypothetical protein